FDLQKAALPELGRARLNPNDPKQADKVNVVFRKVLDSMIMDILLEQEAKRLSITVSDSEIDQELTKMMKMRRLNRAQFEAELKKQGMSVDELRKSMKTNMLRQRVMGAEVGRRVVVTDDEIRAYYEKHKDTMYDRNGLHMGLIVYNPNVNARSIAAQIASGALSFEEAARKYSIAPNREKGGDMGPVEWGRLNPEWETRLNKMKPGDVTDIFTVQGHKAQVHLFRPGQSGPGRPMTFEEARPVIDNILRQPKAMERFDEYSQQLRSKAVIDIRL
ncbi:peptidylprolyl isomerase, partial [Desulfovibrio sp.]